MMTRNPSTTIQFFSRDLEDARQVIRKLDPSTVEVTVAGGSPVRDQGCREAPES